MSEVRIKWRNEIQKLKGNIGHNSLIITGFEPTDADYTGVDDKADFYAIVSNPLSDAGLIVYGYSVDRSEWVPNWSSRHVIRYLLDTISLMESSWSVQEFSKVARNRINGHLISN